MEMQIMKTHTHTHTQLLPSLAEHPNRGITPRGFVSWRGRGREGEGGGEGEGEGGGEGE